MTRLVLVRHGEATAGWGPDRDPGLSELGHRQAEAVPDELSPPRPIRVSPLRRARETAAPLERAWSTDAAVDPVIRELPSPSVDPDERVAWIRRALQARWGDLHDEARQWRETIVEAARTVTTPEVWVTHFVVINAVVGAVTDAPELVVFAPGNCSVTEVEVSEREISLVRLGRSAETDIR